MLRSAGFQPANLNASKMLGAPETVCWYHSPMGKIEDVIRADLKVLFCGINPGLYSAAAGHNFARPGNRFWRVMHAAGFTDRLLHPSEERLLLDYDCGLTNIVERPTASAAELSRTELERGGRRLIQRALRYKPGFLAVLGLDAYRIAFGQKKAAPGRQETSIQETSVWVLPNPSGLNAHYQVPELVRLFRELCVAARVRGDCL